MAADASSMTEQEIKIQAEQIRGIHQLFPSALLGSTLGGCILIALQWSAVPGQHLLYWFVLLLATNLLRARFVYRFKQSHVDDLDCLAWGKIFFWGSFLAGIVWAIGVFIAFPPDNLTYQATLAIVIVGMGAGATSTISMVMRVYVAFTIPMALMITLLFILEGNPTSFTLAVAHILALIFSARGALAIYQNTRHNIRLRIEAEEQQQQLIEARNEAQQANQRKSIFLANMSHEIRTPLHGILSFAQFGIDKVQTASVDKLLLYFTQIKNSGSRLKLLLDDLLDLSKLQAGKMVMQYKPTDLEQLVDSCIAEQQALFDAKQIELSLNLDAELPLVECDPNRIGQVLMNIISNALKFSPSKSTISVALHSHTAAGIQSGQENVLITISDQGPGIPEDELNSIFQNYVQGSTSMSTTEGTGLGLTISQEIVNAHDGRIWCENNPQSGATFAILLPVSAKERMSETP